MTADRLMEIQARHAQVERSGMITVTHQDRATPSKPFSHLKNGWRSGL